MAAPLTDKLTFGMEKAIAFFIFVFLFFGSGSNVFGADRYSVANGAWSSTSTWSTTSGGSAGASAPAAGDNAIIENNKAVTISANAACTNLSIASGASLSVGGFNITVSGTSSIAGTITFTSNTGAKTLGSVQMDGGTWTSNVAETYTITNLALNGSVFNGSATGTFSVSGSLTVDPATTNTFNASTITINGTTTISGTLIFASSTGTKTLKGLVTINSGGIWNNSGNEAITFSGGITNSGTFNAGTGVQTFSTNSQAISGTLSIPNITVTGITLTNNGALTVATALAGTGGLTNASSGQLYLDFTGTVGITTLTTTASGNLVDYGYAGTQTIRAGTYSNLTISSSGAKTISGVTVNGVFSLEGTATASAAPVYGSNATLQYNTTTTKSTSVEWITPFVASGGVIIAGTGTITLAAAKVLSANVPLTINSGASLNTSTYLLTLGGDFSNSGTFTCGTSGVTIADAATTQTLSGFTTTGPLSMTKTAGTATITGNVTAVNLTVNGSGGTLNLAGSNTFSGTRTISAGTLILSNVAGLGAAGTALIMNGGVLDLMTDNSVNAYNITIGGAATISADRETSGAGIIHTLGTLSKNASTLTISGGTNVTGGTAGITFGAVTHTAAGTYTVTNPVGGGTTQLSIGAVTGATYLTTINGNGDVIQTGVWGTTSGGITYSGTGSITLNQANTFSGAMTISSGTVSAYTLANSGSSSSLGTGATTAAISIGSTGTLNYTGTGHSTSRAIVLTGSGATIDASGSGTMTLSGGITGNTYNLNLTGSGNGVESGVIATTTGTLTKTGSGTWTLSAANTYTGSTTITSGTLQFGIANTLSSGSVQLNGGTLRTGASTGYSDAVGTLSMSNTSAIGLGTGVHTLTFSASNGVSWTPGTVLTISGWTGSWNGTTGTAGKIFFGNSSSGLTVSQLAQIRFYNGSMYFPAVILSTGEVVPTANYITTGTISGAPFCEGATGVSVPFTYSLSSTYSASTFTAQLSNSAGSFTSPVNLQSVASDGSGSQTISVTIPLGTATGTGYRIRVVSNSPAVNGTDNGSNLTITAFPSAAGTITGPSTVVQGQTNVAYTVPVISGATTYVWTYSGTGATITGNTNSISISFSGTATSGNLTVKGQNSCAYGTISANFPISVGTASPCDFDANSSSGITFTPCIDLTTNPETVSDNFSTGSYFVLNVIAGMDYVIWTCSSATNSLQMTLYDENAGGDPLAFGTSLDGSYCSDNDIMLFFTPTVSGQVRVMLNQLGDCSATSTTGLTLRVDVEGGNNSFDDENSAGTDNWIGQIYDGTDLDTYLGYYTQAETFQEGFGTGGTWPGYNSDDESCFDVYSDGDIRGSVKLITYSVRYIMNSTKSGLYRATMTSDDGVRLYVDGVSVFSNWADHSPTVNSNVLMSLTGNSTLKFDYYENAGQNVVGFTNFLPILENTLTTNTSQSLCLGSAGSAISGDVFGSLPSGISLSGTGYQWAYSSTSSTGPWTNISGATAATYTPTSASAPFNAAGTYYIIRKASLSSTNNVSPNPYVATNNSNAATLIVSTATVAGSVSGGTTICSGSTSGVLTLSGNTGSVIKWQSSVSPYSVWSDIANTSSTYTSAALTQTTQFRAVVQNGGCAAANSSATTVTVNPGLPVSVSIAASASTICSGTSVTFTATPTNGGTTPAYQWKLNGANVGANSTTYSNSSLANNEIVTCVLTSNATCATGSPATSNAVTMTVNPNLPVSVSISASATTICSGTSVTFTATPTNGGSTPVYQWKLNGTNVGTNSSTYTNSALANGNTVNCVLTSNATCATGSPATSNTVTMTVNPNLPASVSISASATTICSGTSVTFTATPTNGGTTPVYQWKLNGTNVGTNSTTYANASLANNDVVACVMTSNATCATGSPATSNAVTMTVNPNLPASVSISASATTICSGTSVTFTATPTNGGSTPAYQWKLNGSNVGSNSTTYINSALANNDVVICVMTSNATCATGNPATSNSVTMTVNPNLPVSVSVSASATTICSGTSVTFTATPTNGGASPSYQWKLNGSNVGTSSSTYTNSALANGNTVSCVLTSNATCATGSPATSNTVTMTVNPNLPASVSIAASATTICSGTSVTFTATPVNGGSTPTYQWKLNGANVGTNSTTYTSSSLANNELVTCVMTSNAVCATGSPATSNTVTMTVNPNLPASVSIAASATTICSGTTVTFTATPTNGGSAPTYQWKLNGANVGTSSTAYSNSTLVNNDVITCVITSNATCATGSPATSNSVTMTVNPNLPVSVSVSASATTICSGTSVTFTATPTNGGASPAYQWKLNGSNVGTSSSTYTNSALANGNTVTCVLTSNATCATGSPATSNTVTMTVSPNLPVSLSIAASSNPVCSGSSVTFTATPTNGGSTPVYQWKRNGSNVGTNSATYSSTSLSNNDVISCVITSNATCATGNPATSNSITLGVTTLPTASISYSGSPYCYNSGTYAVTFSGTSGGTYTASPSGLSINASTGAINTAASTPGTYTVTYTISASGGCSEVSASQSVTINPLPTASISGTTAVCLNAASPSVTFTGAGSTAPYTFAYTLNGGVTQYITTTSGNSVTVSVPTSTAGTFVYSLISVTGSTNCYQSQSGTATVTVRPDLVINDDAVATLCQYNLQMVTATPAGGSGNYTYSWQVTTSGASSLFVPGSTTNDYIWLTSYSLGPGTYNYQLTVTDATWGCTKVKSYSVTILSNLNPTWVLHPSSACVGQTGAVYSVPSLSATTYAWTVSGGTIASGQGTSQISINWGSTAGTGTVTMNSTTGSCTQTLSQSVSIYALPTITLGSNPSVCSGVTSANLTYSATTGSPNRYSIDFNAAANTAGFIDLTDATLSGSPIVLVVPGAAAAGTYSGSLTVRSTTYGCNSNVYPISVTINPNLPASISVSPSSNPICSGASVTFTATPTNGGSSPSYQWKLNGSNVGSGSATYTSSGLANNDIVSCILTSNATCATGSPATSNSVTMTVNPNLPASVSVAASATTICSGTVVTFTATPVNGGTTPSYQWKVNGFNAGGNSTSYSNGSLANNDVVSCVMTSNATCATGSPATSNSVTMTVNPNLPVSVSISASETTICSGASVTFTASPVNGGSAPTYQWLLNGSNVGTNSSTYTTSSLSNNDIIRCQLTSNATCATGSPALSNQVTMTVNSNLPVSVNIAASATTICQGMSVTFTATPTNGGTTPSYQWKLNGANVGTNSNTYTTTSLANNDVVSCVLTSNASCIANNPATSNLLTITVNPNLPVSVSIAASASTICAGTSVTFTATPTNGGSSPSYQWLLNGSNTGTGGATYVTSSLVNGNAVSCIMTSSIGCSSGSPATSNTVSVTVNSNLPVSVGISVSANPICAGSNVTFTATPVNGGTSPVYQWMVNDINVGTNSSTYSTTSIANDDIVTCQLTSNVTCAINNPATSFSLAMIVNEVLNAGVSITASSNPICAGTSVTFTAVPTNGGSSPVFQWKLNGSDVGTNSASYTNASLANGDQVYCVMTSDEGCISGNPAASNTITMVVNPNLPVSVTIAASPSSTICSGTTVTFTATPVNGGASPVYQWKKNGSNIGAGTSTYTDGALVNGDVISCVLTSSLSCVSGNPATSGLLTMVVNQTPTDPIAISASPSSLYSSYSGTVVLTASGGGGTGSVLKWYTGGCGSGSSIGTGSPLTINAPVSNTTYYARWENGSCVSNCLSTTVTVYSNYRSKSTGDWSSAGTWEIYSNGTWIAASVPPTASDGTITIQSPHTVTVSSAGGYINVDELTINSGGKLIENTCPSNWWLTIPDGPGTDITVNGTFEYQDDKLNLLAGATMVVGNGGKFQQNLTYTGNYPITIPTASWDINSTYEVLSSNQAVPAAGLNQTFGNFTWNYSGQTADLNLAGALSTIAGNFTVVSTGSKKLILTNSTPLTLTIGKDLIIQGGTLDFSSAAASTKVINLSGNYSQTGGTFTNSNSGVLTLNFKGIGTTFTQSAGTLTSAYINWDINSSASLTLNNNLPVETGRSCTLNGVLDCGVNNSVNGAGSFVMASAARLIMGSPDGITSGSGAGNIQTVSTNFTTNGDFVYNGTGAQATGNRLPSIVRNLTISNSGGATLTSSVTINSLLTLSTGNLSIGINTLTFQNADIPIVTAGGKLNPVSSSNLAFGTAGNIAGAAYTLPDDIFTPNPQINNFTVYRTNSLTLNNQTLCVNGVVLCNGPLVSNGKLKLLSTAVQTALIDGSGSGTISGNVTMQRYVPSAFGYKYFSSPFQSATVAAFSPYLDLQAAFPTFYKYDENRQSSGWVSYVDPAGQLIPPQGYAANFGTSGVSKTVEMTGLVNNNLTGTVTLYNHNYTYTKGYNLAGNPYPSPIDWNASAGWTKNNIDNALYFFNAGNSDQYTGTYSTYINGVSSDGIASNIIPSMQGFFIHVNNGNFPVSASFGMDNRVRVNNLSPTFHKSLTDEFRPILRLSASYEDDASRPDHAVVYLDDRASREFNSELDALKLMNTDEKFPNLFAINSDRQRLSIKAIPTRIDSLEIIPLGISLEKEGWTNFDASGLESLPVGIRVFLVDSTTGVVQDLIKDNNYHVYLAKGEVSDRFSLVFSYKDFEHLPPSDELFNAYYYNQALHIYMDLSLGIKSTLVVSNMLGQRVLERQLNGNGSHEVKFEAPPGIYEIDLYTPTKVHSRKINKLN